MNNWKILKIEIQGFKAFSASRFNIDATTLITLEGPNGYGKTSVFDALELLLTGRIARLSRLVTTVMQKKQSNYEDNLYWNTKRGKKPLIIKAEFENLDTKEVKAFARYSTPDQLSVPANNRADRFEVFKLCSLEQFDSTDFSKELPSEYFDELFGENFTKNYSLLNYLHQGENAFIFGSSTAERKNAIESLIDSKEITEKIAFLGKVERRLTASLNSATGEADIARLSKTIKELSSVSPNGDTLDYTRISTRSPSPDWDSKEPFPGLDHQRFLDLTAKVESLIECLSPDVRQEIGRRQKNKQIEAYIERNTSQFGLAVSIGKHLHEYDSLRTKSLRLRVIQEILGRLKKDAKELTVDDLEFVKTKGVKFDDAVVAAVVMRDNLATKTKELDVLLVSVIDAREDLKHAHGKMQCEPDSLCPMCGHDWLTNSKLEHAIDITGSLLAKEMDSSAKQIVESNTKLNEYVAPVREELLVEQAQMEHALNRSLLTKLENAKESFDNIRKFNDQLAKVSIDYEHDFVTDEAIIDARRVALIDKVRARKTVEGEDPPSGWEALIAEGFASMDDFDALNVAKLELKLRYLAYSYRLCQNSTLQTATKQLNEMTALRQAREHAKAQVSKLKKVLTDTERRYSGRTIADIELIFHIYSGRLIQNYQRGLGLFIERGDGNRLQFSTAERSEHDATLSMSSGQLAALSMAFFLALNRVYSKIPFVLIDDPAQSLDDINVASLTDLLRCELRDRQLLMSSHEDDIAAYMRYRFERANLSQKAFHMQRYLEA